MKVRCPFHDVSVTASLSAGCKCARGVLPDAGVSGAMCEYMTGVNSISMPRVLEMGCPSRSNRCCCQGVTREET